MTETETVTLHPTSATLVGGPASVTVTGCPRCGCEVAPPRDSGAQQRILELESQVKFLNERAVATGMFFFGKILIAWKTYVSDS
jgi:hypothetical protein